LAIDNKKENSLQMHEIPFYTNVRQIQFN